MKQKLSIGLLMLTFIMALGAIGLTSCSNDDDLYPGVYEGYIDQIFEELDPKDGAVKSMCYIIVTHSPDYTKRIMPAETDCLLVYLDEVSALNLKEKQTLSFRILSAKEIPIYVDFQTCNHWKCKIEILKIY